MASETAVLSVDVLRDSSAQGCIFGHEGYFVLTEGADEEVVRAYIRAQEQEEARLEQ